MKIITILLIILISVSLIGCNGETQEIIENDTNNNSINPSDVIVPVGEIVVGERLSQT